MIRALLELLFTIFVVLVARAVLTSMFRGLGSAAVSQRPAAAPEAPETRANSLHKDPVCGTYVSESTRFQSKLNGQTVYYCSQQCLEKHTLAAR